MNAEGHEDITKRSKTPGVGSYTIKRLYPGGQKYTMRGIHNVNNDSFENISPGPAAYNPIRVNKIISYKFEGKKDEKPFNYNYPGIGKYSILHCYKIILKKNPNCVFGKESRENSLKNWNNPTNFNRYNLDNPGVGTYKPNINYVKKSLIGYSFNKAPRQLHQKIPDYKKNSVLFKKKLDKSNLIKSNSNFFNRTMILNKSNYFNQNENNKSNRSFNKEKNFYEKTFNRTMSQNDIYYYKNIK
jgi:hypothetical protein